MQVLVIGGSGLIGRRLVHLLQQRGHAAAAASPSTGVDTLTGRGLAAAMAGAQAVVDVSNSTSFEAQAVMDFFRTSTRNLLAAARDADVAHYVTLSIVNTDRPPGNPYFHAKAAQEEMVRAGGVPFGIVRATQFHEFAGAIVQSSIVDGVARMPRAPIQTVAADDVAATLADVVTAAPIGTSMDLAGPQRMGMDELARQWLAAQPGSVKVEVDPAAGYFGGPVDDHTLVPLGAARIGSLRFSDWLQRSHRG